MSLQTFVLSDQNASLSIAQLLAQASNGGMEIRNAAGGVVAYVLPPDNQEAWAYAEASLDILHHRDEILAAMKRRQGVTTKELLENAERAGMEHDRNKALQEVTDQQLHG